MTTRIALAAGALVLAAVALWHPVPHPVLQTATAPAFQASPPDDPHRHARGVRERVDPVDVVVYVAGAVRRPGLYHPRAGGRVADAVAQAGGLSATADAGGVNLAARVADGDEIYVPAAGDVATRRFSRYSSSGHGRSRRMRSGSDNAAIAPASIDVNATNAQDLGRVPGIGRALAARIVEMREREGAFASLDELLDVAGMTQTRLERARPFLTPP